MFISGLSYTNYANSTPDAARPVPSALPPAAPILPSAAPAPVPPPSVSPPSQLPFQNPLPPSETLPGFMAGNFSIPAVVIIGGQGDTVELSRPLPPVADRDSEPLIPQMPGSGLLDSIKPEGACHTCANRKYVDGSNDASVSYQTPTNINPNMAAAAVASHEQEHVRNEQARAHREDRQVVSQTVTLHYDCCPECGKHYVSGGTTRTTTASKSDTNESIISGDDPAKTQQSQPSAQTE